MSEQTRRLTKEMGWGQLLAGVGAMLAIVGALHLIDAVAGRGSGRTLLLAAPSLFSWGAILLLGLALTGLGVLQLTAPDTAAVWRREVIPPMPTPPILGD